MSKHVWKNPETVNLAVGMLLALRDVQRESDRLLMLLRSTEAQVDDLQARLQRSPVTPLDAAYEAVCDERDRLREQLAALGKASPPEDAGPSTAGARDDEVEGLRSALFAAREEIAALVTIISVAKRWAEPGLTTEDRLSRAADLQSALARL